MSHPAHVESPAAPALPRAPRRTGLRPLDLRAVRLSPDGTLGAWQELNAEATLPHCIAQLESSGVIDNFRRLLGESGAPYRGFVFADSDLYKVIEAVAWEIGRSGTTAHHAWLDEMIALITRAQEPSGYLHTWIQGVHPEKKFAELHWTHELYVLGHWLQAGIALARTDGRTDLLERALDFVDLVERRFGPGREDGIPGHPEIETALVELHRLTGEPRHLALAQHLVDQRGRDILPGGGFGTHYFQDHLPVREAADPTGHAVRQLYLNAGVTDLFLETGEEALGAIMREQWERVHTRKMYLTGAFGSRHRDESFGNDHELPSDRAYAETCATIADLHWTWRMMLAGEDPRCADVIERELHNALPAAVDRTGTRFFYSNPLQRRPDRFDEENAPASRQEWYSCACCPPNIARTVAQLGAYVAAVREDEDGPSLEILQHTAMAVTLPAEIGEGVLEVETDYPATGTITLRLAEGALHPAARLGLRLPGWLRDGSLTTADGAARAITAAERAAGRLVLGSSDVDGAVLRLDMPPRWTRSHPRVDATRDCLALERGPLVHCLEQVDMPDGVEVDDLAVPDSTAPVVREDGTVQLQLRHRRDEGDLYRSGPDERGPASTVTVTALPFARWGNRGPGAMRIWLPRAR
ncbi:glycoside hydrolase family 127 protein [Brachybacterium saurashtrense]|uniref:Glycoside hydrolase family 127 protein n=1 Tax=Brachybacterium saurashtrense TaxID=556288 RepID=A0A345YMW4_9MICO|nr:beta-L-arabinofuranosidase domain-containing protein [Brachybacterium saurashtrense]AXK45266.1 glycoside hydrolase family 127 protein [Brachybacterium saurashtrense]RRR21979.1 glycoside hydrolase family 127 protein [Brachybacterium saurashtrense]